MVQAYAGLNADKGGKSGEPLHHGLNHESIEGRPDATFSS